MMHTTPDISQRKIPSTMVSQHPDHAGIPYWHTEAFISTREESQECFLSFSELNVDEYKWDWEGKLVDESVIERLVSEHFEFFQKNPLGKEKFLTFRLPNPKVETEFRLGRAFMGILTAANLAKQLNVHTPPLFEVILPMVESPQEMIDIQEAFREVASLKHKLYSFGNGTLQHIQVIPLFEQVDVIMRADTIIENYLAQHVKQFQFTPTYLRPYLARSDPALNSGLIPTVLAIKIALSRLQQLQEKTGVQLFPIIGSASLPFRGGLTPDTVDQFIKEYPGIRTSLLQSAFRYDWDKEKVKRAIVLLQQELPKHTSPLISSHDEKMLIQAINIFEPLYKKTVEEIADTINAIAMYLPPRRERVQHTGLFGYSRSVGKVHLPRAIGFTAALYSLGIPPELIGAGRGLTMAQKKKVLRYIEKYYVNVRSDLTRAGYFLNKKNLSLLAKKNSVWNDIISDVTAIEEYLGESIGPRTTEQVEHEKITSEILTLLPKKQKEKIQQNITQAAILRKSLG